MTQGADPDVFRMCLKPRRSFLGGFVEEGNVETGARCNKKPERRFSDQERYGRAQPGAMISI
jgi:hypothetical protein